MPTQVILLERIENLGGMGDIVNVKPGYARNYLLPQNKALRANDANIAYFEKQKSVLEKSNDEKKKAAQAHAKAIHGLSVTLIRQAGEGGQLYGSVTARDISDAINDVAKEMIGRNMVTVNQNFKEIGLFDVVVTLHPEVKETVTINIARTEDEAKKQAKTGKAAIADYSDEAPAPANDSKAEFLEEGALEAEKEAEAKAAADEAEEKAKAEKKAEAKKAKKAAAPADEEAPEAEASAEDDAAEEEKA